MQDKTGLKPAMWPEDFFNMKPRFLLTAILLLLTCGAWANDFDHHSWDELLRGHVVMTDNPAVTTVDYSALLTEEPQLDAYLAALSAVTPTEFGSWSAESQLAFLINAYNAWTIKLMLSAYPGIQSIKDLGSLFSTPWEKRFIKLLGSTRSLDDIEHNLIRGSAQLRDPRIHFAVNCASIGCPALRPEAYTAASLDTQLEDQTRRFLADRQRNRLRGSTLAISPLFKWYREDFERDWRNIDSLNQFLISYAPELGLDKTNIRQLQAGRISIEYTDYDWRLNDSNPPVTLRDQ